MADAPTAEEMAAAAAALGAVGAGGSKRPRSPLDDEEEEEEDESVEGPSLSELEAAADSAMSGAPRGTLNHRGRRVAGVPLTVGVKTQVRGADENMSSSESGVRRAGHLPLPSGPSDYEGRGPGASATREETTSRFGTGGTARHGESV